MLQRRQHLQYGKVMPDPHLALSETLSYFPFCIFQSPFVVFTLFILLWLSKVCSLLSQVFRSLIYNNYLKQQPSSSRGYRETRILDTEQLNQLEHVCTRMAYSKSQGERLWKLKLHVGLFVGSFSSLFCFLLPLIPHPIWFQAKYRVCTVFPPLQPNLFCLQFFLILLSPLL